jgi:glucan phosphoethanolaminetransferase (alkaline phosphatase superfamily)
LGVVIYFFTVKESIENHKDFIKIHCLFIIMIIFVSSLNGLRWFNLKRAWEIILFGVFLFATGAMYFLDFYKPNNNNKPPPN